jgi:TRAP-type C4-dicarboxylate transport system permease small subunit
MEKLHKLFDMLLGLLLAGMVVLVFGNVLLRYGFNSGIVMSEELSRLFFVWLTFIGAVMAMLGNEHIGMDAVLKILPAAGKKTFVLLACIGIIVLAIMLALGAYAQMQLNWDNTMPVSGMPVAYQYLSIIFCGVSIALIVLFRLVQFLRHKIEVDGLLQVHESAELNEIQHEQVAP